MSAEQWHSLIRDCDGLRVAVSSVLNKNRADYGKQHLIDGSDETCWNSEQGSPQSIAVCFPSPVDVRSLSLMFQGGFVGADCQLLVKYARDKSRYAQVAQFYPDDCNRLQCFDVEADAVAQLKLLFPKSSDFYGRVTVYHFDVKGRLSSDDNSDDSESKDR
jgi:hypothetical protein